MNMKLSGLTVAVALALSSSVFGVAGCSSDGDKAGAEEAAFGTMAMSLTGQTNGTTYRLRNALFEVSGPTHALLDSELDPEASLLATTLATGDYTIELQSGWVLQRLDAEGYQVVDATLVSENPVSFDIVSSLTTNVVFTFETSGQIIDIGAGHLQVSIAVVEAGGGGGAACDILSQTGCGSGQSCYWVSDLPSGICGPTGSGGPGDPCSYQNDCGALGLCASTDGVTTQCFQFCATDGSVTCPAPQSCLDLGVDGLLGACL